jgi:glycosidase
MDKYKAKPADNPDYKINKPDERTMREQKLLLIHQFTFIGAPQIWNGEEVGMWGADDPDCRKPIVWDDLIYEVERANYNPEKERPVDVVKPDKELFSFYQKLIKMRKDNPVLIYGNLTFPVADDEKMILAYVRSKGNEEIVVVFNRSDDEQSVFVPVKTNGSYKELFPAEENICKTVDSGLEIKLQPLTAIVLKRL